jgi:hypothetical protein
VNEPTICLIAPATPTATPAETQNPTTENEAKAKMTIMMMCLHRPFSSSPRRQHDGILLSIERLSYLLAGLAIGFISASFGAFLAIQSPAAHHDHELSSSSMLRLRMPPSSLSSPSSSSSLSLPREKGGTHDSGWNEIHVFVGDDDELREEQMVRASAIPRPYYYYFVDAATTTGRRRSWFSQVRQDELVAALLRYQRCGYFVDLAANDAVRISNTYSLERDYDWSGLAIEPNPIYWAGLVRRPRARIVAAVVAGQQRDVRAFRFPKEKAPQGGLVLTSAAASIVTGNSRQNNHRQESSSTNGVGQDEIQMQPTVSLAEILDRYKAPNGTQYVCVCACVRVRLYMCFFVRVLNGEPAHSLSLPMMIPSH